VELWTQRVGSTPPSFLARWWCPTQRSALRPGLTKRGLVSCLDHQNGTHTNWNKGQKEHQLTVGQLRNTTRTDRETKSDCTRDSISFSALSLFLVLRTPWFGIHWMRNSTARKEEKRPENNAATQQPQRPQRWKESKNRMPRQAGLTEQLAPTETAPRICPCSLTHFGIFISRAKAKGLLAPGKE
jgi:hypothetical protein